MYKNPKGVYCLEKEDEPHWQDTKQHICNCYEESLHTQTELFVPGE